MWQHLIVWLIVGLAARFVIGQLLGLLRGQRTGGGCGNCSAGCGDTKPLVTITMPTRTTPSDS